MKNRKVILRLYIIIIHDSKYILFLTYSFASYRKLMVVTRLYKLIF
jgi:hypothetical protein